MSLWVFVLAATGVGGALLLWHTVSRAKLISEIMLRQYADMLADARRQKARELEAQATEAAAAKAEEAGPGRPPSE